MKHDTPTQLQHQQDEIIAILARNPTGLARGKISENLSFPINYKTLQRRLADLIDAGRIIKTGDRKAARYALAYESSPSYRYVSYDTDTSLKRYPYQIRDNSGSEIKDKEHEIFSHESLEQLKFLETPPYARERVTYHRDFLDSYVPNQTTYVPENIRQQLDQEGRRVDELLAAGTYARQICQRLLIDLSYNSSRLEGNTYSRLDTQRLVEEGVSAQGKVHEETVMIINHKEAILFLVENAQNIELNSLSIRNLHYLLAQDLLPNPQACGNLRTIAVDIGQSTYRPLENPHVLKELFELVLLKARKIEHPFEQSFFVLVHLSYLQAFEDVNKRTARLGCNIPFIRHNLCPLSFTDVARDDYTAALLAIYEKNAIGPMLDLYVWAYRRSCTQYGVMKKSLGEIDAFRIQYRQQRKDAMGKVIRQGLHGQAAEALIEQFSREHNIKDRAKFIAMTLSDLDALHSGAIIGLGITEAQFHAWQGNPPSSHL